MAQLELNEGQIERCRLLASRIVASVRTHIDSHSSVGIERAALRLVGVEGAVTRGATQVPFANLLVDQMTKAGCIGRGALFWFSNGLLRTTLGARELAAAAVSGEVRLTDLAVDSELAVRDKAHALCAEAAERIAARREERDELRRAQGDPFDTTFRSGPLPYVIVATGNIFEDVVQARAAAHAGASAIAVIRSTAQSLLDYVPEGATTEGFGGTYATQENFKIMRAALDEVGGELGRYIRLTNYSSGLCMSEIAAIAAMERLDFLLNDAMYGILFRDINMQRTLIDQHFSRKIVAAADIVIHTGEDNYLTTADAVENGHQVLASQFINERFAFDAGMRTEQMGLGHAAEMDPWHPDVLLLEIARAQMTRQIFPRSPIKFMPPTRFKVGDIFFSHLMDAMFNLVGAVTNQGIQLLGMPTEAMHTPLLQDRWMSIKNARYVFGATKTLGDEIVFRPDGKIAGWAAKVLNDTEDLLERIAADGLFGAIEKRAFANVSRTLEGGKGLSGVFKKAGNYVNPFFELL